MAQALSQHLADPYVEGLLAAFALGPALDVAKRAGRRENPPADLARADPGGAWMQCLAAAVEAAGTPPDREADPTVR
jgi:hypothetical protein